MIHIEVTKNKERKEIAIKELKITSVAFHDTIYECKTLCLNPSDTLSITYDLEICGYTDGVKTSTIFEKFQYVKKIEKMEEVRYIRLTKIGPKAAIRVYSSMPVIESVTLDAVRVS